MAAKSQVSTSESDATEGTIVKATPFQVMLRAMAMDATAEAEDSKFTGDNLTALLTAESEEEIWDADERGPLNFQHLADCEIAITDIAVKFSRGSNSEIATPFVYDGKKMYLLVTAYRLSDAGEKKLIRLPAVGEIFQANTSAQFVTTKLWAFYTKGYINPDNGKQLETVVKAVELGDEQSVLKLRPMPRRVVRTEQ